MVRVRLSVVLHGKFVVRFGIRVMLGLALVSSRFGIISCRLLYGPVYYVLVIYLHLK